MVKALHLHRAFIHSTSPLASNSPGHTLTYTHTVNGKRMVNGLAFISCFYGVKATQSPVRYLSHSPIPEHIHTLMEDAKSHTTYLRHCSAVHTYTDMGMESTGPTTRSNLRRRGQEESRV